MNTSILTFIVLFTLGLVPAATALDAPTVADAGIGHAHDLDTEVYLTESDDGIALHWQEGITHCWILVPTDGTADDVGPTCVY